MPKRNTDVHLIAGPKRTQPKARLNSAGLDQSRITLDQLRVFVAVADREHITGAAKALRMSQGSVSGLVHRLEATLGLPLFQRVGRNVRLTDVGESLRRLAARVLEEVSEIEDMSAGYHAVERGEITIAAGRVMGAHRLARWVAPFAIAHPHLTVRISLAPMHTLVEMLLGGTADVVMLGSLVKAPEIESLILERTDMVLLVSSEHPLASAPNPLGELGGYRYLAHEAGTSTEPRATEALNGAADASMTVELEEGALYAALLAGLGFAMMPRSVVANDIDSGRLIALPRPGRRIAQVFSAARRRGTPTPAQHAFWEYLTGIAAPRVAAVPDDEQPGSDRASSELDPDISRIA
jgi:DNA-binding transcriptional LysR family regulator